MRKVSYAVAFMALTRIRHSGYGGASSSFRTRKHEEISMKMSRIIVGVVVCALSSQVGWSQQASPANPHRTLGYFDYATGAFRPVGQMDYFDSSSVAAANAQAGTLVVNFTITIRSAIPTTTPIFCNVSALVTEVSASGVNLIQEDAVVAATRTGNMAKCTVTIPYSWVVVNPVTASVTLSYNLIATKTPAGTTGFVSRLSTGTIASIPVPANGGTTTETVNAVL
jgi:hypothetical protein